MAENKISTTGNIDEIVRLYEAGKTMAEIGTQFSVSRQRICQLLAKKGVHVDPSRRGRKPVAKEISDSYVAAALELGSKVSAAEKFGVSVDTIGRALRRAGISLRSTKFTNDTVKTDIINRYKGGERLRVIAESYGTRAQHVNSLLRKWGVQPQGWNRGAAGKPSVQSAKISQG
jgi:transposase